VVASAPTGGTCVRVWLPIGASHHEQVANE
jgi:hypothetical protein